MKRPVTGRQRLSGGSAATGEVADGQKRKPAVAREKLDLVQILSDIDETAYDWDLRSDRLQWESNACTVLGIGSSEKIATGEAFHLLIAPEHHSRRNNAMGRPRTKKSTLGVPFRVNYRFCPQGPRSDNSVWLEEHGRCWHAPAGSPKRARGVIRLMNETYWQEKHLLARSDHDELTGQLNRTRLTEALGAVLSRAKRAQRPCAFLMVTVNNLSAINESFGFDVGDEVVAATARLIKESLSKGHTIGRYSSNKFGIIVSECAAEDMQRAAERFMNAVRRSVIRTTACRLSATISVGGVVIPDQAATIQEALSYALSALDKAKQKRFSCFMAFEPSPSHKSARQRNIAIADDVVMALEERRMRLVLQPIISAKTRRPAYYECLARMHKPDGSVVRASEFIPVAERLGLWRLIDERTLELAVDLLKKRKRLKLALNVSSLTTSDHEWLRKLRRLTRDSKQITRRLMIEITETAVIHDLDQAINFVDTLKELGCRVAIDDFGAGYTSFKILKALAVDVVKIDGAFVENLADDAGDQVFIKAIVELADTLRVETVAEWVSNEKSARILEKAGIGYLQGFHFGMPFPPEQLAGNDKVGRDS